MDINWLKKYEQLIIQNSLEIAVINPGEIVVSQVLPDFIV